MLWPYVRLWTFGWNFKERKKCRCGGWIGLEIAATARKQGKEFLNMATAYVQEVWVRKFLKEYAWNTRHKNSFRQQKLVEAPNQKVEVVNHPQHSLTVLW